LYEIPAHRWNECSERRPGKGSTNDQSDHESVIETLSIRINWKSFSRELAVPNREAWKIDFLGPEGIEDDIFGSRRQPCTLSTSSKTTE